MSKGLPTPYQQFIHKSRYAKWIESEQRREDWHETVDRYLSFITVDYSLLEEKIVAQMREAILNLDILPSMRALMMSGNALNRCNVGAYNCAYTPIDDPKRFSEILYILMCGTGMGFSVERQEIAKLPDVPKHLEPNHAEPIVVEDSRLGWAVAYQDLINGLFNGVVHSVDYSLVRPAGTRLKTTGGRASGPAPLKDLFDFTVKTFTRARGRKLTSIEVHDTICKIGDVVVVGGVRRSALISLSNLSDDRMRQAKSGEWWKGFGHRALANNSAVYTDRPDIGAFMEEWVSLYKSKSGERGLFSRQAANKICRAHGRKENDRFGTNPCSEIILQPQQFCNLTEVVIRAHDDVASLATKVRLATILGTLQARLVDFQFLSKEWRETTESEALLGVSLTGIFDGKELSSFELMGLRDTAVATNRSYAKLFGINPAAAITCVKPSGTVSQLADCASGIHPRHSPYYLRRVRGDRKDPLTSFLITSGVPNEPCVMKPDSTVVFTFPQKAPLRSVCRHDMTAKQHLEAWLHFQVNWCQHKPSVTISVQDSEWLEVGAWVYKHFDWMSGVSFLPYADHTYRQAPYEDCTKETFDALEAAMPVIDWNKLRLFEAEDNTSGSQTLACSAGVCEVVDIT